MRLCKRTMEGDHDAERLQDLMALKSELKINTNMVLVLKSKCQFNDNTTLNNE